MARELSILRATIDERGQHPPSGTLIRVRFVPDDEIADVLVDGGRAYRVVVVSTGRIVTDARFGAEKFASRNPPGFSMASTFDIASACSSTS